MNDLAPPTLFLAGHPAIDFLNSAYAPGGQLIETLADGRALLDWMTGAKLLSAEESVALQRRFTRKALDSAAQEARTVREWVRTWLASWRANPARDYSGEVAELNKLLAREDRERELVVTKRRLSLVDRSRFADANALLAPIAVEIARLVTGEDPSLLKACAGADCTLWFLDRTKAHRRLFCSASTCGNRAKVAAFRLRQRE
ncbi:MAG TPA: ABATE domain-containing protein [Steroidobacteraceae bacterium]|nr:ABATE domain-containing protein [Steroidobacteraceae bacterium]